MTMSVPDACTLPVAERPPRLTAFDRLMAGTLRRVERVDPLRVRVTLAGGDATETAARTLAERESGCCGFFAFTIARRGDEVLVDIGVPAAQRAVVDGLYARLSAVRVRR
jgi:hypothetical protein